MSAILDPDDRNPRVTGRAGSAVDCFMCWNCGHLNFHDRLWCACCHHGQRDNGDWRMRLCIHELILAAATDVPGARGIIREIEADQM